MPNFNVLIFVVEQMTLRLGLGHFLILEMIFRLEDVIEGDNVDRHFQQKQYQITQTMSLPAFEKFERVQDNQQYDSH